MAHLTHGSDSTPMRFSSEEQEEEVSTSVAISNEHRNSLPVTEKLPSVTPLFHQDVDSCCMPNRELYARL